jgi:hypothetical protein
MGLIIEYEYFSPSILFKNLCTETHLLFEQYETYQKRSFRNRCTVAGAGGSIVLSIPLLKGRNQKSLTKDIKLDNSSQWQGQHWKTIISCYNRSPWFYHYFDELDHLYKMHYEFLVDWNLECFSWAIKQLELRLSVNLTDTWMKDYDPQKWDDWRNRLLPGSIQEASRDAPTYRQVFQERTGFIPHLSVLDLLFCEGKNARFTLCNK